MEKQSEGNATEIIAGTLKPEDLGVKALSDTKLEFRPLLAGGSYVLTGWSGAGISCKYEKNPYNGDAVNIYFDEINVQVVKEVATGVNLNEAGELDGISSNQYLQNENLRKALI